MSKYAVYASSKIYHLMRDGRQTKCGVQVFTSNSEYQDHGYGSSLKLLESVPEGLRLCQLCSGEGGVKKGGREMSEKRGTIESQTKTTRRLDEGFKQSAEREVAEGETRAIGQKRAGNRPPEQPSPAQTGEKNSSKKALTRWESEGGAGAPKKKGGKQ